MSKLSSKQRKNLPQSDFALSGRRYPIPDAAHARDALSRASAAYNAGHISKANYDHIKAMADKKLGETPKGKGH
jgi:hypothetical protein